MPSAKPVYDTDGHWKHRQFNPAEWSALTERLQRDLKPFYPDQQADACPEFGDPFDAWVNALLAEAWGAVSGAFSWGLRLSNEQLQAEQRDTLKTLEKAARVLGDMSFDLDRLLGVDADVLDTKDRILALIPYVESAAMSITEQPKAFQRKQVDHAAAVEMAIRVLRVYKASGGRVSATADMDTECVSDAIKILAIIGEALGLVLSPATWRGVVSDALAQADDLKQVRTTP